MIVFSHMLALKKTKFKHCPIDRVKTRQPYPFKQTDGLLFLHFNHLVISGLHKYFYKILHLFLHQLVNFQNNINGIRHSKMGLSKQLKPTQPRQARPSKVGRLVICQTASHLRKLFMSFESFKVNLAQVYINNLLNYRPIHQPRWIWLTWAI